MPETLLYVDDSEDDRFLCQAAHKMARAQCQLILLNGGPQAVLYLDRLEIYADRSRFPDPGIILLDVKMPDTDGFGVLRHLRADPGRATWRVGLLTSSDWPGDVEQARKLGATWYFRKPPDLKHLVRFFTLLDECLEGSQTAREAIDRLSILNVDA